MINVTKPFLPPLKLYEKYLKEIWNNEWLTNDGPLVQKLEENLKGYLGVEKPLFVSNGTIALQLAIKGLGLKGEVITTPFSYVATASSIIWEHCTPVFADIDPNTLNIDPTKVVSLISTKTTGIIATHVFGNPCKIDELSKIAEENNLKLIFDAAHCFGTIYKGKSVFNFGDISTASFHATKVFHTVEGGAVFTKSTTLKHLISKMRNFGHDGPGKFFSVGINGKNSEYHAAMGLANLKFIDSILKYRKKQYLHYSHSLKRLDVSFIKLNEKSEFNYAYMPIIFKSEKQLIKTLAKLNEADIYPRRYFYPTLNKLEYINREYDCPVAESISTRIVCLPIYYGLSFTSIDKIVELVAKSFDS